MATKILDGRLISAQIRQELKAQIQAQSLLPPPTLAVVLCTDDPASEIYVAKKQEACSEVGITSQLIKPFNGGLHKWPKPIAHLLAMIDWLNSDSTINGILIQLPLPPSIDQYSIFDHINPIKDVDVFSPINTGLLLQGRPRFIPCTPQAIQELLVRNNIEIAGKKVTIINRSNIVGKPLSALLIQDGLNANATVSLCHDHTPPLQLKEICLASDIIVVAVGKPGFLTADMVSKFSIVIDVGITRIGDRILGDVTPQAAEKVYALSPVPGGVGPMTVTMLLKNTIHAQMLQYIKSLEVPQ